MAAIPLYEPEHEPVPEENKNKSLNLSLNQLQKKKTVRTKKVKENVIIIIPTFDNYNTFLTHKLTILQLKHICKYYKLNVTGNKQVLTNIIYKHLYLSYNAAIIQKIWRQYSVKVYARLHGPAQFKRHLCVNETDFFTMDALTDIPYTQFFSYKDSDNMIYGFDIMSLYNLINNTDSDSQVLNPYTRSIISNKTKDDLDSVIYLSYLLKEDVQLVINEPAENKVLVAEITGTGAGAAGTAGTGTGIGGAGAYNIEHKALHLFHDIDTLGNYTNPMWFLELRRHQLLVYIRELYDIWTYRAQLTDQIKFEICPNGPPFHNIHLNDLSPLSLRELQFIILTLMDVLINQGINQHSRYLGSTYVLCALTLVSESAAEALPWLYESVAVIQI
jgi:hypothetical protein